MEIDVEYNDSNKKKNQIERLEGKRGVRFLETN